MKKKYILLLLLLLGAFFGLYQLKYWLGYASDLWTRPWAYSTDPQAKLLVGKWQARFVDPAGVEKQMALEILPPVSEEERRKRASDVRRKGQRRRNRESKQAFDGIAVVKSRLGEERYEIFGAVEKSDIHRLSLHFVPEDEAKRVLPNDSLLEATAGQWEGDRLELTLAFSRQDAQGFSSTEDQGVVVDGKLVWQDSAADQKVTLAMSRAAP